MRLAVIYRPRHTPPFDAYPEMFKRAGEWYEKYGHRFEALYFFAGGGGIGIIDANDSAEVQRITAENPFTIYADVETHAAIDPETSLRTLTESLAPR